MPLPHLHPQAAPVELVSPPCPAARRSKLQASIPFSPFNSATSSGSPNLNQSLASCCSGSTLSRLLPDTGGFLSTSQRPSILSTCTGPQGSACLINEVPWQPGPGRVEGGRWKDRQREGISSWPSHPAPAEKASQPGALSPEAQRPRPAPGSGVSRQEGEPLQWLINGLAPGCPTSPPSNDTHYPAKKFWSEARRPQFKL